MNFFKDTIAWFSINGLAVKRGLLIAGCIAGVFLFLTVGVTAVFLARDDGGRPAPAESNAFAHDDEDGENFFDLPQREPEEDDGGFFRPPARTNFLLVGLDQNSLADAIMVGTFYRDSGDIHLMSVPRDMHVRIPPHRVERMNADGLWPPHTLKVNEMRSHGGQLHGIYYLQEQLSEMFGVEFDFFVEVQLSAFRRIVDAIGGVYMDIPRRLFYLDPTATPPLRIDVPAGNNVRLDGAMAEGVVRYRQWPMGDIDRNAMQMEFMTQLIRQAATREALLNDPRAIIATVLDDVRSNVGLAALTYIPYIPNVSMDSVSTFAMPGAVGYVAVGNTNREFFIPDTTRLPGVIREVFHATFDETESLRDAG